VNEGSLLTFDATATDSDIPANTLTYSLDAGAPAGATINSSTGVFTWTPTNGPSQSASITVRVTDNGTSALSDFKTINVTVNNVAPELNVGAATATLNEGGTFSRSGSFSDPGADTWTATVNYGDGGGVQALALNADKTFSLSHLYPQDGSFTVTVSINDGDSGSDTETITVTVNNVLPVVSALTGASINEGGSYSASGSFTDPGADTWTATVNYGDGTDVQSLALSAKNFTLNHTYADDDGSPFTVTVTVNDDDGSGNGQATVIVLNVAPTINTPLTLPASPVAMGSTFSMSWTFTDPGSDSWKCKISWDQPVAYGALFNSSGNTCSVSGASLPAGVYTVTVYVEDDDGGSDQVTATSYIVVFDPSGGFVTGGGWINSLPGYYRLNGGTAEGRANFGFVSKYVPGKNLPTGNTEFQFQAGNLNFKSTIYEWLVVAGAKALYKGEGTIAGLPGVYGFLLSAIDGSPDKFRIKIWDKASGDVVYDTLPEGAADDADPATTLGGGSIVVHTKK
jgi:large repetitive protein